MHEGLSSVAHLLAALPVCHVGGPAGLALLKQNQDLTRSQGAVLAYLLMQFCVVTNNRQTLKAREHGRGCGEVAPGGDKDGAEVTT